MDQRLQRLREPAYWRQVHWVVISPVTVGIVCAFPSAAVVARIVLLAVGTALIVGVGACFVAIGFVVAPWTWRVVLPLAQRWLAPAPHDPTVAELKNQRADLPAAHGAEIRRIERDLHDGAQARLVTVGPDLAAAERLVKTDPDRAETAPVLP